MTYECEQFIQAERMILKHLRFSTILAVFCCIFVLLIPHDPKNALFLGLSATRLAMLASFALLAGLAGAGVIGLRTRPDLLNRMEQTFSQVAKWPPLKDGIPGAAAILVLLGIYHLAEWLLTTDDYQKALLLRLTPVSLFLAGLGVQGVALQPLQRMRQRWVAVIALTCLCTAGSRFLQEVLLNSIDRPYVHDARLVLLSQAAATLAAFLLLARLSARSRRKQVTWGWITALLLVLFLIQWFTYPAKYWRSLRDLALAGPLIVFAGTLLVLSLFDLWDRLGETGQQRMRRILQFMVILSLVLLIVPFYRASMLHSQVLNYSAEFTDQAEYLLFAKNARLQNFHTTGDNNRMPGYPFILALFYRPGMSDADFFELGKRVNIWLSLALLILLFLFLRKYLSLLTTALLTAIVSFSLYIFKAPYIQAESIYYFLALVGFVLALRLLIQPDVKLAVAAGVVLGLAHLTKASVLPALLLFAVLIVFKELFNGIRLVRARGFSRESIRPTLVHLGILMLIFACFLAVIFPYIRSMKQRFGHYFYNVNTTFYIWFDDNPQSIAAEQQYHFADRWPSELSPDQLPGPAKYFREHTPSQILERVKFGLQEQGNNLRLQFSVTNFHLSYLVILVFVFLADVRRSLRLAKKYRYAVVYTILYFAGYLAAFVWYSPISPERRFTYSLFLPFLFSVFVALRKISEQQPTEGFDAARVDVARLSSAAHLIIALTLLFNVYLVLVERMMFDRYGS